MVARKRLAGLGAHAPSLGESMAEAPRPPYHPATNINCWANQLHDIDLAGMAYRFNATAHRLGSRLLLWLGTANNSGESMSTTNV